MNFDTVVKDMYLQKPKQIQKTKTKMFAGSQAEISHAHIEEEEEFLFALNPDIVPIAKFTLTTSHQVATQGHFTHETGSP